MQKKYFALVSIITLLLLSGCAQRSNVNSGHLEYKINKLDNEFEKYKTYNECLHNYQQRTITCVHTYAKKDYMVSKNLIEQCIRNNFPNGKKSCNK